MGIHLSNIITTLFKKGKDIITGRSCIGGLSPKDVSDMKKAGEKVSERNLQPDSIQIVNNPLKGNASSSRIIVDKSGRYVNEVSLSKIKKLSGSAEDNVDNIKNIFMDELGYPRDLISIKIVDDMPVCLDNLAERMLGGFYYSNGNLILNSSMVENVPKEMLATIIRHELDHFDKAAQLCKSIGIDEYEKIFKETATENLQDYTGKIIPFSREFWQKAVKYADTTNFDTKLYHSAFKKRLEPKVNDLTAYSNYLSKASYVEDEFEKSAISIQRSIEKYFKIPPVIMPEKIASEFRLMDKKLDSVLKFYPEEYKLSKPLLFEGLMKKAIVTTDLELSRLEKIIQENPQQTESISKYIAKYQECIGRLQGNFDPIDCEKYTKKIFQKMVELSDKKFSNEELYQVFVTRFSGLVNQSKNILAPQKELVAPLLVKHIDDFLVFIEKSGFKLDSKEELNICLTKVLYENEFSPILSFYNRDVVISEEIRTKIFKNKLFNKILDDVGLEKTNENKMSLVLGLLNQVAKSISG